MEEMRNAYKTLFGKPKERHHSEDVGVDSRIILEWISGKKSGKVWTRCVWFKKGTRGGSCEYGNEPLGSTKGGEFLD
jgi:hypothetical protein